MKIWYNKFGGNMIPTDYSELLLPYEQKWVVMTYNPTQVVASGDSLKDVAMTAKSKHIKQPVFLFVPKFDTSFASLIK